MAPVQQRLVELRTARRAARAELLATPGVGVADAPPTTADAMQMLAGVATAAMEVDGAAQQPAVPQPTVQTDQVVRSGPIPMEQATAQQGVLQRAAAKQETINHNWDVYHCLVSQKKDWLEQIAEGTKQLEIPKQLPKNGGGLEAVAVRGGGKAKKKAPASAPEGSTPAVPKPSFPPGWFRLATLRELIAKHGLEAATQGVSGLAQMQQLLKERVPEEYADCPVRAVRGPSAPKTAAAVQPQGAEPMAVQGVAAAPVAVEVAAEVVAAAEVASDADAVPQLPEAVGEILDEGTCIPCEPAAEPPAAAATAAAEPPAAAATASGDAPRGSAHALKLLQDKVRKANKDRMAARKQLTELSDVLRNHYYRTCKYMGSLHGQSDNERARKGWIFWLKGLEGHVLLQDHRYCGADAKCRQPKYEEREPLNTVAETHFRCFIMSDAMNERLGKCCHNAHTWDAEAQAALYHVYAMKRVVTKMFAEGYAYISKFARNEGLVARMLQLDNPYTEKVARTGARRLAHHDKPVFEKNLTPRTHFFQTEVDQRMYLALVDPNRKFASSGWHALRPAPAIVRPMEAPLQVPELLLELTRPATEAATAVEAVAGSTEGEEGEAAMETEGEEGAAAPPGAAAAAAAGATSAGTVQAVVQTAGATMQRLEVDVDMGEEEELRRLEGGTGAAAGTSGEAVTQQPTYNATVVREHGRISLYRLQELQAVASRPPPLSLLPDTPRSSHILHCAACGGSLQVRLAVGISEVQCLLCKSEFAARVDPDPSYWSKAAKQERRKEKAAPRTGPAPPRAQMPFQVYMKTEVRNALIYLIYLIDMVVGGCSRHNS